MGIAIIMIIIIIILAFLSFQLLRTKPSKFLSFPHIHTQCLGQFHRLHVQPDSTVPNLVQSPPSPPVLLQSHPPPGSLLSPPTTLQPVSHLAARGRLKNEVSSPPVSARNSPSSPRSNPAWTSPSLFTHALPAPQKLLSLLDTSTLASGPSHLPFPLQRRLLWALPPVSLSLEDLPW